MSDNDNNPGAPPQGNESAPWSFHLQSHYTNDHNPENPVPEQPVNTMPIPAQYYDSEIMSILRSDFSYLWDGNLQHPHPNSDPDASTDYDSSLLSRVQAYDWAATLTRLTTHPHEAKAIGFQGRTALHVACDHDAPAVVVHNILKAYPHAAIMVGTSDMNPLHITCSSQHASVDVVRVLLEGCKRISLSMMHQVTSMKDVDGDTPLHAACRCGAPIEVLGVLLHANPMVVHDRDYEGLTPLLRLWVRYFVTLGNDIMNSVRGPHDLNGELSEAWEKTRLLLQIAYASVTATFPNMKRDEPFNIVHAASILDCPREVLKIATLLYPEQINTPNSNGDSGIMIACTSPTYPEHDLTGEGYYDHIHETDFNYFEEAEASSEEGDRYSETYHHSISSSQQHNNIQHKPIFNYPSELVAPKQQTIIQILLEAKADASKSHPKNGRIALDMAIASGKTWSYGVKSIKDAYPDGLLHVDPVTGLYPFMLAASVGSTTATASNNTNTDGSYCDYSTLLGGPTKIEADLTTIYELIRCSPEPIIWCVNSILREEKKEQKPPPVQETENKEDQEHESTTNSDHDSKPAANVPLSDTDEDQQHESKTNSDNDSKPAATLPSDTTTPNHSTSADENTKTPSPDSSTPISLSKPKSDDDADKASVVIKPNS